MRKFHSALCISDVRVYLHQHVELDCRNESQLLQASAQLSIACSSEHDQGVVCLPLVGSGTAQTDELYIYYVFAHTYKTPDTKTPAPQSVHLTPVHVKANGFVDSSTSSWPTNTPILIGHAGAGAKHAHQGHGPFWPDNTICAFRRAEQLGLPMVECDATVTRGYRTVLLHHNFTVRFCAESRSENEPCERTFTLDHTPDPPVDEKTTNLVVNYSLSELRNLLGCGPCSSDGEFDKADSMPAHPAPLTMSDPLPDASGIQGQPLPELADSFRQTSIKLGFNVEFKYPRETLLGKIARAAFLKQPINNQLAGPHSYFASINKFCDKILDTIWKHAGSRVVILSSFNADLCAVLRLKQTHLPVLFITRGGVPSNTEPPDMFHVDLRHQNLGVACSWAHIMDLAGVVTMGTLFGANADGMVVSPEDSMQFSLDLAAKQLACFVYGMGVSERKFLEKAAHFGLTGVIIDHVDQYMQEHNTAK
ncbi:hypothetical protein P879_04609 [Paragonimus westermani]|uniref:GP-PDE domain-containing protein n=1 Tax=Paragonimus westermani TaxID=34504 RepID=A0A8T0D8W3_9TREM|nr:hypothetical protein P879_04609 [Paragonimus westermani]